MSKKNDGFIHKLDLSAILTVIAIIVLFSCSIGVILLAPYFTETAWRQPSTPYQVQMYEISDPNFYISSTPRGQVQERQLVYHLKNNFTLLAFQENEYTRIIAPDDLEKYVTYIEDTKIKLTSRLLLLRQYTEKTSKKAEELKNKLTTEWEKAHPDAAKEGISKPAYVVLELYAPETKEAFARATTDGIIDNWVSEADTTFMESPQQPYHNDLGVIYVSNPEEYRIAKYKYNQVEYWRYDPKGIPIASLEQLKSHPLGFMSRKELISFGEHLYAIEGCWYCHTDQTRTLVQDVVLNGSDSFPAPPSSPNEYIYQEITFPGTRRIGPDLSRVGVKRPSRDWHKAHFWAPKTESPGSIMPTFRHFFDNSPSGTPSTALGIPNYQFEAIFQYLMTKGTRITPPTEAWWLGKDPIKTKEIIEGLRTLP